MEMLCSLLTSVINWYI